MTISTTSRKNTYAANGVTTVWPFTFLTLLASQISLVVTDSLGIETTIPQSAYSIAGLGLSAGGSVTYPLSGAPVAATNTVTVVRTVPYTQADVLSNQGGYYPVVVEQALDKIYMALQQLKETQDRTLQAPVSDTTVLSNMPAASVRANNLLGFDVNGNPYAAVVGTGAFAVNAWVQTNFFPLASAAAARTLLAVPGLASDNTYTGTQTMSGKPINEARGANVASAGAIDLTNVTGNLIDVTGAVAITAITLADGASRTVRFTGALVLTNSASLILPGSADINTIAGDVAVFRGYAAGVVRCVSYQRFDGGPLHGVVQTVVVESGLVQVLGPTVIPADNTIPQIIEGDLYLTLTLTPKRPDSTLHIEVLFNYEFSAVNMVTVAIFRDLGPGAIDAAANWHAAGGTSNQIRLDKTAPSTAAVATTFTVRAGGAGAGQVTMNGVGGVQRYGGVYFSRIRVTEIG